jgi:hypothetical protein
MSDILVLLVLIVMPAAAVIGPLTVLTLGLAAVADLDGNGLIRSTAPRTAGGQPAPGSLTSGPAALMASVTPSA